MGLRLVTEVHGPEGGGEAPGGINGDHECAQTGARRDHPACGRDGRLADATRPGDEQGPGHISASSSSLMRAATSPGVKSPNM